MAASSGMPRGRRAPPSQRRPKRQPSPSLAVPAGLLHSVPQYSQVRGVELVWQRAAVRARSSAAAAPALLGLQRMYPAAVPPISNAARSWCCSSGPQAHVSLRCSCNSKNYCKTWTLEGKAPEVVHQASTSGRRQLPCLRVHVMKTRLHSNPLALPATAQGPETPWVCGLRQ